MKLAHMGIARNCNNKFKDAFFLAKMRADIVDLLTRMLKSDPLIEPEDGKILDGVYQLGYVQALLDKEDHK